MSSAGDAYQELCKRFDTTDYTELRVAFEELVTDDCVWANTGFPTAEGKAAVLATLDAFHQGLNLVGVRVENIAVGIDGDTVVTERVDHLVTPDGIAMSLAIAGTFTFSDGKLKAWRDYFDPRPLLPPS